jgi:leucyl-tRNA synthetase
MILGKGGEKMSKSLGNVINPDDIVSLNGADALRVYEVFLGPVEKTTNFDIDGVRSMKKWLDRVYNLFIQNRKKFTNAENFKDIANDIFFSEKIVLIDSYYRSEKLNLVVSSLMSYLNHCHIIDSIPLKYGLIFLQMLNPIAPHITEEI